MPTKLPGARRKVRAQKPNAIRLFGFSWTPIELAVLGGILLGLVLNQAARDVLIKLLSAAAR